MKRRARLAGWALGAALVGLPLTGARADEMVGLEFIGVDEVWRLQQTPRRFLLVDVKSADEFREA